MKDFKVGRYLLLFTPLYFIGSMKFFTSDELIFIHEFTYSEDSFGSLRFTAIIVCCINNLRYRPFLDVL